MKKIKLPNIDIINKLQSFALRHPKTTLLMMFFIIGFLLGVIVGMSIGVKIC